MEPKAVPDHSSQPHPAERLADLHVHTDASDGVLSSEGVLEEAMWNGISCIAITDHDTISGVAAGIAAGEKRGIEVIPGVELSCVCNNVEVHILGYCIRHLDVIENVCKKMREHRIVRMQEMVAKAQSLGFGITYEEVEAIAQGGSLGRPHLARLLVKHGYVDSIGKAFDRYIGDNGSMNVPKKRLSSEEGIGLITQAGGVSVLAHPFMHGADSLLPNLVEEGLQGLEVFYYMHTDVQQQRYLEIAHNYKLLITGGSDYHGGSERGPYLGQGAVPYRYVEILKNTAAGQAPRAAT
ncbi:MAG: PHP domain-containing protein [Planctomycetes bacterium]|nr:PHP domain-containing protein [Planctomycetota bacterium]